jgi:signal transduction histidine kinase/CheY-like chemotaxis protein
MNTMLNSFKDFTSYFNKRDKAYDAERGQAVSRVIVVPLIDLYMMGAIFESEHNLDTVMIVMLAYSAIYIPGSWILLHNITRRPGYSFRRRVFAIVNDYLAMTFAMVVGGAITSPVFALVLWVTVGNGLRYGTHYLLAATGLALASIVLTWSLNSYWQENPYLVLAFLLTTILIPAYNFGLLKRLKTAYDAALEANRAKSRLLAQASHDLRQPIHAVSLFTACLRDTRLNREQQQLVDSIDHSLHSVAGLFRSLLDISTLDSGKVKPQFQPIRLNTLMEDVIQQNREAAKWADAKLRHVPCSLIIYSDPTLLSTILQNLVSNAIKYAAGQRVLIGCRRRGDTITIEVHDHGDGIADHHLLHVFDEFYRARERGDRDIEGVGLGLAIVKRLAELLFLQVSIHSVKGIGTCVRLTGLPVTTAEIQPQKPRYNGDLKLMRGLRVLLIEDDQAVLEASASLLEKWGCIVQQEFGMPRQITDCDLVITDFDLGAGITGMDCIHEVRRVLGRQIPAIVMTGHEETRVKDELNSQDIPVLQKPIRPAELRTSVMAQKIKLQRQSGSLPNA